jgi:phosphatidate cytidylyltransferase
MLTRILSGIVALSLVLPVIMYGGVVGAKLLVGAVLLVVLKEFSPIASPEHPTSAWLLTTGVGASVYAQVSFGTDPAITVAAMVVAVGLLLSWAMFVHEDPEEGALSGAVTALVVPYIAVAMAFIGLVRDFSPDEGVPEWLFFVLILTWVTDSGAYFAGRLFGKRKLIERISPKKTWAGVYGGVICTVLTASIWAQQSGLMPVEHAAGMGAVLAVSCVVGDLVESMFKRARGIKDSGGIMPGHGGLFDRVDSLLFTMPVAWLYAELFGLV